MSAYTAVLTVNMVFEWHPLIEEMKFMFKFWMPSDFVRAMNDRGPIASRWRVDQIEEIPIDQLDEALEAIHRPGRFEETAGNSSQEGTKNDMMRATSHASAMNYAWQRGGQPTALSGGPS